jgi:hypothetical protein
MERREGTEGREVVGNRAERRPTRVRAHLSPDFGWTIALSEWLCSLTEHLEVALFSSIHLTHTETMAHTSPMALDRRVSASPPPQPQPLSKRDKRRNNITDKLSDMIQTFTQDQHQHYRAQLQAIQVDMTMILRANPYENSPLDDSAEHVEQEIENVTGGSLPNTDASVKDYLALAGKRYHEYVQQINHALEQRDADLTALQVR